MLEPVKRLWNVLILSACVSSCFEPNPQKHDLVAIYDMMGDHPGISSQFGEKCETTELGAEARSHCHEGCDAWKPGGRVVGGRMWVVKWLRGWVDGWVA